MDTVVLILKGLTILGALYVTVKAFQDSLKWGCFFLLMPVIYAILARKTDPLAAGAIVIGLQLYYVVTNWQNVGTPYAVTAAAFLASELLPRIMK